VGSNDYDYYELLFELKVGRQEMYRITVHDVIWCICLVGRLPLAFTTEWVSWYSFIRTVSVFWNG
jgi:hypothetical protein